MSRGLRLSVYRNPARRAVEIYMYDYDAQVPLGIKPLETAVLTNGELVEPTFFLSEEGAQGLLDELWREGFRPQNYEGTGTIEATRKHLEDMRKIAFNFIEKQLGG